MHRTIRLATYDDIPAIMLVIDAAREMMHASGNVNQWINGYPSKELIHADIARDGDMWEQYYDCMTRNFAATMKFLYQHHLIERFQPNLNNILKYSENCGWGFEDDIKDIYYEYIH